MSKKVLNELRKEIAERERELHALVDAANLLIRAENSRGKKSSSVSSLVSAATSAAGAKSAKPAKKGKRGRPAGSKNKPNAKKTGPKPRVSKVAKKGPGRPAGKKGSKRPGRIANLGDRIIEMIAKSNRFMTNAQITDRLEQLYPDKDRTYLGKYMSVILSNMKKRRDLVPITKDRNGNKMRSSLWGLPNWFNGNEPKSEHLK